MKTVSVSTHCPFCGASVLLVTDSTANPSTAEIATRFAGTQVECQDMGCEKTFFIRRADLKIRRATG